MVNYLLVGCTFCLVFCVSGQGIHNNLISVNPDDFKGTRDVSAQVEAIIKGTALLPCDLTPSTPNDTVLLVVWYKDEHTPIYSYDTRGQHSSLAKHWQEGSLDTRAFFRTMMEPSTLSLDNINEKDEGEYRCRIDYLRSPTKNFRVKLTVIVPPRQPTIIDENGKEITSVAGPYQEGGDMKLTCIVSGGKPEPSITWWRGERLIHSAPGPSGFPNVLSNQMIIRGLTRADLHAAFTCKASNNNISQPISTAVTLEIHFRPLTVEILSINSPLSAERRYEIMCQTFGSRPPAKITWFMDGKELKPPLYNTTSANTDDTNGTTSSIFFVPTMQDNGKMLTCRATNQYIPHGLEESSVKLNIFYVPIPLLTLGSNLNPDDIEEGDDVYFECKVNANPWAYKVLWKHNGKIMQHDQKGGVIISSSDLALQGITKNQSGNYSCIASNVEGDGESNMVSLKIMFKPICHTQQKRIYGVARHEKVKILCEVESYPPPDTFRWSFNNSAENVEVPQERYQSGNHRFSSILTYTQTSELDYGTVICWASNLAGKQSEPCVFHLITAGKPDPPFNCSITNQTTASLEVECNEGFDGGQPQFFILEIYDQQTNALQANITATLPLFTVGGLEAGKELKMVIFACNSKGRSDQVILEGYTLKIAEKQTVLSLGTRDEVDLAPVLGVLVGLVAAMLILTVVILWTLKMRNHVGRKGFGHGFLIGNKEKVAQSSLRSDSDDLDKDEKNPDVIPTNKDSNYQLDSAAQTPGLNEFSGQYVVPCGPNPNLNVSPLDEVYMVKPLNEITYAELSLARPNTLETGQIIRNPGTLPKNRDDATIYAQIDHSVRPMAKSSIISPLSPVASLFPVSKPNYHQKEVITIRTPLIGYQQESCV